MERYILIRYEPIIFRAKTGLTLREGGFIFRSAHGEFPSQCSLDWVTEE